MILLPYVVGSIFVPTGVSTDTVMISRWRIKSAKTERWTNYLVRSDVKRAIEVHECLNASEVPCAYFELDSRPIETQTLSVPPQY